MKLTTLLLGLGALIVLVALWRPSGYPIRNATPAGEAIVCFGDSLTFGTGASPGMDYPSQLSRLIGRPVVNLGVPGNTTTDALARLDQVLEANPRIVMVTLGGNDLKHRIPKEQAFANLKAIVSRLQERGALVVIGGIDIPLLGRGYGSAYETLARDSGSLLVPNVFAGVMGRQDRMSDPIHPNDQGYGLMAEAFHRVIAPYLR